MNLINNSLNLNRLDTYSINNTYILLNKSINDSIQNHIVSINKLGLSIINKIPDNIFIYCDKFLYDRILKNLISNAIKFNEPSGIIEFIHKIINKKIHLTIKNTGQLKISRELLFKPFETSDKYGGGTGLGLSIIHKICKLIDEKIIYDNNEEGFVKFTFTLDYKESITKKIVYIEDNKMNQILMSKILKEYDIDMKNNANNLLSYINNYDILLLDLNLDNNISGLNVIEILKKNNITIPIIVITADTNNKTLEKLHKLGIKFFNKPIMVNTFKLYIKKHFLD